MPHVFRLRGERPIDRCGVVVLAVLAGVLLVAVNASTDALIPLYAIGMFIGITLSQARLVRQWTTSRPPRWWSRAGLNGTDAAVTGLATVIFLVTKFAAGGWVVVITIPALMFLLPASTSTTERLGESLAQVCSRRRRLLAPPLSLSLSTKSLAWPKMP
jgi:hypothetical protein